MARFDKYIMSNKGPADLCREIDELKAELNNYANVINQLMSTQLTDTEEVGRLIEIAQYKNWSEL